LTISYFIFGFLLRGIEMFDIVKEQINFQDIFIFLLSILNSSQKLQAKYPKRTTEQGTWDGAEVELRAAFFAVFHAERKACNET